MFLIQPCCTQKDLLALRGKLGENGTTLFQGFGDLSLAELLPPLLTRYSGVEMMIVAPTLPDAATEVIASLMEKQYDEGKSWQIGHLTLVTDMRRKKSPLTSGWQIKNPFGERLALVNVQQNDTAIILPDIALVGNINLAYGGHFTALATKKPSLIEDLRKTYLGLKA